MARRKATGWTCRRRSCKAKNPPGTRKCQTCGHPRPVKKPPAHAAVLKEMTYEDFMELTGGDFCSICGYVRKPGDQKLDRDHDHRTGAARGLLCRKCNRILGLIERWLGATVSALPWVRNCLAYLQRTQERTFNQ